MAAGSTPIYRVTVTARTAKAINYQHRSGATKIDFRGTELLPKARGEAKVESKQGYIEIEVEFDDLQPANKQGAEYLTYVLWAITPEGRTSNLGEILLNGTKSKLNVTTELQVFGLVVTAEPYFAVTRPSDLIVMENVVRADTKGKIEEIDAKYELLQRGQYQRLANPLALKLDQKLPLELYEARNAVQIARAIGRGPLCRRDLPEGREEPGPGRSLPGTQRRQEAGDHDCPRSRADGGRCARNRGQAPGRRCAGRGTAAVGGARSARGERTGLPRSRRRIASLGKPKRRGSRRRPNRQRLTREKDAQAAAARWREADRVKRENEPGSLPPPPMRIA